MLPDNLTNKNLLQASQSQVEISSDEKKTVTITTNMKELSV